MQALGSYAGGSMLFLGLGTGLGSTMIVDKTLIPLELAHLPYMHGNLRGVLWESAGFEKPASARGARRRWPRGSVLASTPRVDYVVLGEGTPSALRRSSSEYAAWVKRERVQGRLPSLEGIRSEPRRPC